MTTKKLIAGRRFVRYGWHKYKSTAQAEAKELRDKERPARVLPSVDKKGGWEVWAGAKERKLHKSTAKARGRAVFQKLRKGR